jgi:hypothetical protein
MFFKQRNNIFHPCCHATRIRRYIVSVIITMSISWMMAMGVLTSNIEHHMTEPKISCGPFAYFSIGNKQMGDNPTPA